MKKALLLILTLQVYISLHTKAQCSFTTTINNSGTATGCGPRVLTAAETGNVWTQRNNFGGYSGQGGFSNIAFSIGTKGYMGLGYNNNAFAVGNDFWEYDPATDSWTQKANFGGVARQYATGFSIGSKGYVGCGYDGSNYLSDFWEYNPATNTWAQKASISGAGRYMAMGFGMPTKGYLGCGYDYTAGVVSDFYEYDPSANTWTQKANFGGGVRYGGVAFSIGNIGYFGTGVDASVAYNDLWEYNPGTNTWTQKSNLPGATRWYAVAFSVGNKGYVGTGTNGGFTQRYNDFYEFNPATNSWTTITPLPTLQGRYSACAFGVGAYGYLINGSSAFGAHNTVYRYYPAVTYSWNTGATTQVLNATASGTYSVLVTNAAGCTGSASTVLNLATQPTVAISGSSVLCAGNSVTLTASGAGSYTWSGNAGGGNGSSVVLSPTAMTSYSVAGTTGTCVGTSSLVVTPFSAFTGSISVAGSSLACGTATIAANTVGDTWTAKTNFGGSARYYAGGFSIGDKGYIGTGFDGSSALNNFYEYNFSTDAWTQKANVGGAGRYNAVMFSVGTKGYVGLGTDGTNGLSDFWEYDPLSDAWTQKANFIGVPVQGAAAMVVGSNAYILGGNEVATNSLTSQNWQFNPQANAWTMKANYPAGARRNLTAFGIGSTGYAGLGFNGIYYTNFFAYNPATDTWTAKAAFAGLGREAAAGFVIGGKAYVGTGTGASLYSNMFEYNPVTDSWKSLSAFGGTARYGAVAFAIGSKGYVGTGYNGSASTNDFWEYTPPGTFLWSNAATTQTIYPTSSGNYTVSMSNYAGCTASALQSISIAAVPALAVSGATFNCGNPVTLSVTGASSYTWSSNAGSSNASNVSVTPSVSTNYTVSGTLGTCTANATYYVNGTLLNASVTPGGSTLTCGNQTLTAVATASTWFAKTNFAGTARSGASAFVIGSKGYICLGVTNSNTNLNDLWEYDYTSDSWTQKATYPSFARQMASAFAIGSKGYVVGGAGGSSTYNDLWEYDQSSNVWTQRSDFPGGNRSLATAFALGGNGYVGCGLSGSTYYNDFYQYNPATDNWTAKANFTGLGRYGALGFTVGNKGYIGLGLSSASGYTTDIYEYDAVTDSWTAKANFPAVGRRSSVSITIGNYAYIGTGIGASSVVYNDFWRFDPSSNTWLQIANYTPGMRHSAVALSLGGKGYVFTGQNLTFNTKTQESYEFQPTPAFLWSNGSTLTVINPSVSGLYTFTTTNFVGCTANSSQSVAISANPSTSITTVSTLICNGSSNLTLTATGASNYTWSSNAGGGNGSSVVVSPSVGTQYTLTGATGSCVITNTVLIDVYPANTVAIVPITSTLMCGAATLSASASGNTWTAKASFGGTARYGAVAFSIGNKGYYGTGYDVANRNDFWEYDISTNVWTQKANFSGVARRLAAGFAIGNKGYVGTGYTSAAMNDFWEYDPAANTWTQKANYPAFAYGSVGFSIGSKGYIEGGTTNGTNFMNNLREYDPIANTWTSKANCPVGSYQPSAFVIGNAAYVCGGINGSGLLISTYMWNQTTNSWVGRTNYPGGGRQAATAFAIGTKGYVVGGTSGVAYNDVYEFNSVTNSWIQRASIATARWSASAFTAYNRAFLIGGYSGSGNLGDMWQYQALPTFSWSSGATSSTVSLSTTGTYTLVGTYDGGCSNFSTQSIAVSPFPTVAISGPTMGVCGASITLSGSGSATSYTWSANAGGVNTSSAMVSPSVNTTYTLSGTSGSCSISRTFAVIGKKPVNGFIIASAPTSTCGSITLSVSSAQSNTYTGRSNFPGAARQGAVGFAIGYKGYLGLGKTNITYYNDFWEYDAASDSWTQKANYPVFAAHGVAFVIGSTGYVGLGEDGNSYLNSLFRYNSASNSWSVLWSLPTTGRAYAVAFATTNRGYIVGGENGSGELSTLYEYEPLFDTWTQKTSIPGTRRNAVGLCLGNKGYVGLGSNSSNVYNDFWEYDPATDTWTQKTNYPGAGRIAGLAFSINNKGFVGGGISQSNAIQNDLYEYSVSTNSWTSAAPMPSGRYWAATFATPARVYIGTGYNTSYLNDLIEFDPPLQASWSNGSLTAAMTTSTTGTYSVIATNADGCTASYSQSVALSPAVPLSISSPTSICAGQTATLIASGASTYTWSSMAGTSNSSLVSVSPTVATNYSVIAQTGSCIAISSVAVAVNTLPVISISAPGGTAVCGSSSLTLNATSTYTWVQRASCGNANGRMYAVAFNIGTKGYLGTGYGQSGFNNDFWEYDPATNAWTQKANFAGGARQYAVGFGIGTKGYVGTGYDGSSSYTDFWEFDPIANTWTQKTNFGGGARYAAVGFCIGTKGYIGTGIGAGFLNDFWEYDPGTNSWTQKTNLGGFGRYSACAFSIGSKGYISSGYLSNSTLGNDIWEYDQGSNSWTQKASYTLAARYDAASASANSRGYIIGGDNGSSYLSQVLEYNPASNTWAQVSSLAATTSGPRAFGIGSKLFASGGYAGLYGGFNDYLFEYTGSNYPFVWSNTSTLSAITVTSNGNYSVTTTNTVTGCSNTAVQSVSIVPGISVTVSGPSVICSGSANLTASGASNYTWSANAGSLTLATVAVSPSTTTTYSVVGALGTCTSSAVYSVAIAAPITVSAVASPTSVCNGGTVVLNGTGASTYSWSGGVSNNVAFTPTASGSYSVTGTSSAGCTATAQVSVGIAASPTITVSNGTICSGSSFTISPSGATTYTYSGGSSVVSPTVMTTYSITGSNVQGCVSTNTALSTVSVANCSAASALSFDGTNDHVITPNLSSAIPANSNITIETWFKPNTAGVVVGELGNGSLSSLWYLSMIEVVGSGSVMVRVYNLPAVFVGTVSYGTWNHVALRYNHSGTRVDGFLNGVASSSFVTGTRTSPLSASFNQFYQLGGSSLNNLGSGAYFNGSIDEVRIWNTVRSQCDIQTYMNAEITSTASGLVANYHFNQGLASQSNSTVTTLTDASGNSNTGSLFSFALTGSVSNWISPGGVVSGFTTTPAPPTLTVNSGAICSGSSYTIVPVGANTYTYSSGSAIVSPTTTTSYSVTGTATNGCLSNTAVVSVTVNSIPNLTVSNGFVCAGSSYTINPFGATSYTYSGGSAIVSPTATSNYTVSGGNGGCTTSTVISVGVNPIPTVAITSNTNAICLGNSVTLNGSGQTNLVAYYRFDEGSGTTTSDLSGNNLTGTLVGSSTWSVSTAPLTGAGNHLNFSNNYVNVADNAVFNTLQNAITIEAWIYQTDNANNTIVDRANYNFLFSACPNGQTGLGFYNNGTWNYSSGTIPTNQWVHVSVTFNSATSEVKFYMNGALLSTHTRSGALVSSAGPMNIGRQDPSSCQCNIFTGRIDELRIWRGVRTGAQLLASSASTITPRTFVWSPVASLSSPAAISVTASPVASTIYTLTLTDANGCSANAVSSLTVNSLPVVSVSNGTICSGESFTFNPSGANSYSYSGGSNIVSPTSNSVYAITGTSSLGCVSAITSATVTVNALPIISVNSGSICSGESFTMIPSGATTFTYSGGSAVVSPTINTNYSVTGTSSLGCVSASAAISAVTVNLVPVISVPSASICSGATATLTANGANSYTWSTSSNSSSISVSPTINTTYTVNGTSAAGCLGNAITATVSVGAGPAITVNSSTICSGQSTTLSASGVTSFTWSNGANTSSIIVSPLTNTVYGLSGNLSGCPVTASNTSSVSVNPSPTISVNSGSICYGESFTLTASGANTYTYSGGIVVNPTLTSSYSVTGTSSLGCEATNTAVSSVVVNTVPIISVASASICSGATATLTANGANTYTWSTSSNSSSITVSPTINTTYSVNGMSAAGCIGNAITATVTVGVGPVISVNSSTICSGQSATLIASGVNTFTWSSGVNSNSIVVSPLTNTVYTVNGNLSGCPVTASNAALVNVQNTPTLTLISGSICVGQTFVINPSGAFTYTYSSGSNSVSPASSSIYSVTGTSTNGCVSAQETITVTVYNQPTVSVSNGSVCAGEVFTIVPGGAASYSYSSGSNTVAPSSTSIYSVSGINTAGCVSASSATLQITVYNLPTVSVLDGSVCAGSAFTINASGANTYTYSGGSVVNPTATTVYSVSGTSTAGCVSASPALVTVTAIPLPVVAVNSGSVCAGQVFTLLASGANTYTYLNGGPTVTPAITSTYGVVGTNSVGCVSSGTTIATVSVSALPTVSAVSATICVGSTATLIASGANSYTWSNSSNATSITASPSSNITYTVVGTSSAGCLAQPVIASITVGPAPAITVNSGTMCSGNSLTLTANGVTSFTWSTGANTNSIVVSPLTNTVYSIIGDLSGCAVTASATGSVTVLISPTIVVNSGSVCAGESFTFNPSGGFTYTISGGSTIVTPLVSTNYSVSGTGTNGCLSNTPVVATVIVNPLPTVTINSGTICAGDVFTFNPSGATSYTISGGTATVSPLTTTNYSVTGTSADGCVSASVEIATVVVNSLPTLTLSSSNTLICAGESATLNVSGANTFTWDGGSNTNSIVITPSLNTTYTVTGTDGNNCSASSVITQSVSDCLGIYNSSTNENFIKVFPNPSSGLVYAEFGFDGVKIITVYNEIGELIINERTEEKLTKFDLSRYAKGVYYVRIVSVSKTGSFRLMVD